MGVMVAAAAGCVAGLGLTLILAGLRRAHPLPTDSSTGLWTRGRQWWTNLPARRRLWAGGALAAGVVTTVVT
ncbi:MAG: hypothetical protein Q4F67_16890, partial [Propionibacteriaceae bacterium]|nr:hypothetical protein [Propionibacteriaceae bacterium]